MLPEQSLDPLSGFQACPVNLRSWKGIGQLAGSVNIKVVSAFRDPIWTFKFVLPGSMYGIKISKRIFPSESVAYLCDLGTLSFPINIFDRGCDAGKFLPVRITLDPNAILDGEICIEGAGITWLVAVRSPSLPIAVTEFVDGMEPD